MKTIAFILPYFGKLPNNFDLWLKSCRYNETIDFLVFTDDKTAFKYPKNVKVFYCSFQEIKVRIQENFQFKINIEKPWNLSLFKPAYGQIFKEELKDYDFWGYCDADLMWGDIRAFITDELTEKYERIGTKGHASIYKNTEIVNERYTNIVSDTADYKKVFSGNSGYSFDENGMDEIYEALEIPYYFAPNFAHLEKYESSFYLKRLPKEKLYTNKYQVFLWEKGKLYRIFLDNTVCQEEYMYIHFFCRPMKYVYGDDQCDRYVIYPDIVKPFNKTIDEEFILTYGKQGKFKFLCKMIWDNRKKITLKRIKNNICNICNYKILGR